MVKLLKELLYTFLMLPLLSQASFGYCLSKPSKPFCIGWGGDCSNWEISRYERSMDDYVECLERENRSLELNQ
jgi:hypothetical protein